jgi:biopolymer transport protein ExbD
MKLSYSSKIHYESGPNMTPLVDIVMVILIFLMLAGSFGGAEHYLASNLPLKQSGPGTVAPPLGWVPDEPLEIRVDPRGSDGFQAVAGRIRVTDAQALTAQLEQMRRQFERAGTPTDRVQVIISPARNVRYEHLIAIYEAANRAQFTKVAFATSH